MLSSYELIYRIDYLMIEKKLFLRQTLKKSA